MPDCPQCSESFENEHGVRVHHSMIHNERLPNRVCPQCDEQFYSEHQKKYCSESCRDESVSFAGRANPNYSGGKDEATCDLCGETFEYYPSAKEGKYCPTCVAEETWQEIPDIEGSKNPRWNGGKTELECAVCETTFERYPSNVTGEVSLCGRTCRREWLSDTFSGEGHPNWKGGGNGEYGKRWNAVRERALERDDFQCRICGTTKSEMGRNPDVHHITPVRAFVESERLDREDAHFLENVISLCISCHRKAEFGEIEPAILRSLI